MKQVRQRVTIRTLLVGRAARAINKTARSPRTGEGARNTPYASGKDLDSYELSAVILFICVICVPLYLGDFRRRIYPTR